MIRRILLLLTVFMLVLPSVQAASDLYMVLGSEEISGCPCGALENVVTVTNTGDQTDTFSFSLELPSGWSGFIPPEKTLGIGETKKINFYVTPPCFTQAWEYTVKVRAKASNGREFSKDLTVQVLRCHFVKIETEELKETCKGFPADYEIKVSNLGKVKETFDVKVVTSWGEELLSASVEIPSQEIETFDLSVSPPDVGTHYVTISAKSRDSYAKDEKKVQLNVENCYDFSLSMQPKENVVCLGGSGKYVLLITNTGSEEDEYAVFGPEWVTFNQDTIKIPPNTERVVGLFVYPEMEGKNTFDVEVVSSKFPEVKKTITGVANTIECKDVAVVVSPAEQEVCQGLKKEYEAAVKNTGMVTESFDLHADVGVLEVNKVSLEAGEIVKVKLTVDSSDLELGKNHITVTARSGDVSDQNIVELLVEDCHTLEFEVVPKEREVCAGDRVVYTLYLKNTGKFPEEYELTVDEDDIGSLYLEPDQSKTVNATLMVLYPEEETHELLFRAVSEKKTFETTSIIFIKSKEECYSLDLSSEDIDEIKMVDVGIGLSIPIKIKNSGERKDTYSIEMEGPEWVHLSEDEVSIDPGEEEDVYIYASPTYGVESGIYMSSVRVGSENVESELNFMFGVGNVTGIEPPIPPEPPEDNETGMGPPTGMVTGIETTGKVILLGVITLFIIVILALKLVLFVK